MNPGGGRTPDHATVAVVITTRDRPDALRQALESVRAQTRPADEIIVVDDGSEQPVSASEDVVVIRGHGAGVCAARNAGLGVTASSYVTFLDDDDWWDPGFLESHLDRLEKPDGRGAAASMGSRAFVTRGQEDNPREHTTPVDLPRGSTWIDLQHLAGPRPGENTLVFRTEALRAVGGWDERLRAWVHDGLVQEILDRGSIVAAPAARYFSEAIQPGPRLSTNGRARLDGLLLIMDEYWTRIPPWTQAQYLRMASILARDNGDVRLARRLSRRLVAHSPTRPYAWRALIRGYTGWDPRRTGFSTP